MDTPRDTRDAVARLPSIRKRSQWGLGVRATDGNRLWAAGEKAFDLKSYLPNIPDRKIRLIRREGPPGTPSDLRPADGPRNLVHLYADADALPNAIKELLFRAAERTRIPLTLVANTALTVPVSDVIHTVVVAAGPDVADKHIASLVAPGDLVITADLPLALRVVEKGGTGLDPRGVLYTEANIHVKIASRDLLMSLRESGEPIGGPAPFRPKDRQAFANALEQFLARSAKEGA